MNGGRTPAAAQLTPCAVDIARGLRSVARRLIPGASLPADQIKELLITAARDVEHMAAPSAGAEAAMIEAAARYAYDHPAWTWEAIRGGLDRFYTAPQPDANALPAGWSMRPSEAHAGYFTIEGPSSSTLIGPDNNLHALFAALAGPRT